MKPGKYIVRTHSDEALCHPTSFAIVDLSILNLLRVEELWQQFKELKERNKTLIEMEFEDECCVFYSETAEFLLEAILSKEDIEGYLAEELIPFDEMKLKPDVRAKLEELSMAKTQNNMTLSITEKSVSWAGFADEDGETLCMTADLWAEDFTKTEAETTER